MESNFDEVLQDTYQKTLKFAISIAQNKGNLVNSNLNSNDIKFVKKIAKGFREFQELPERHPKKKKINNSVKIPEIPQIKIETASFLPKNSGKAKLESSIEDRNRYLSGSKAGKLIKYAEIGPNVLEKIKINSSIHTEDNNRLATSYKSLNLPHVSIRTGKMKAALELPSFKDYIKSEKSKDARELAFQKINKCAKAIAEFEKEMSGLEIFVNSNPGVAWNNDKKLLLRLNAYPNNKTSILKNYNEQLEHSFKKKSKKLNILEKEDVPIKEEKVLSKTPNPQSSLEYTSKKKTMDPLEAVKRCFTRFEVARNNQNKKLIGILDSLNTTRGVNLRQKAAYILNDTEKFKDKLYSITKMDQIKKKIDFDQEVRLKKNSEQAVVYDKLMEFLKSKSDLTDAEINFVEILRETLEEGWVINEELIDKIVQMVPDEELKDLASVLSFLKAEL
jgi:hypothetical protein